MTDPRTIPGVPPECDVRQVSRTPLNTAGHAVCEQAFASAPGVTALRAAVQRVFARYPDAVLGDHRMTAFRDVLEQQVLDAVTELHLPGGSGGAVPPVAATVARERAVFGGMETCPVPEGADSQPGRLESAAAALIGSDDGALAAIADGERTTSCANDASTTDRGDDSASRGQADPPVAAAARPLSMMHSACVEAAPPQALPDAATAADALLVRWQDRLARERAAAGAHPSVGAADGSTSARRYPSRCRSAASSDSPTSRPRVAA